MRRSDFIFQHRVRNRPEYVRTLIARGSLTLWVDAQAVAAPRGDRSYRAEGLRRWRAARTQTWHGARGRRIWTKLHLGVDEATKEIVAVDLTTSGVHDRPHLPTVLDWISVPVG